MSLLLEKEKKNKIINIIKTNASWRSSNFCHCSRGFIFESPDRTISEKNYWSLFIVSKTFTTLRFKILAIFVYSLD